MVAAIKTWNRFRVPKDVSGPAGEVADEAFGTMVEVMRGVRRRGMERLSAARAVREEVCGPIPKRIEASGPGGEPIVFRIEES